MTEISASGHQNYGEIFADLGGFLTVGGLLLFRFGVLSLYPEVIEYARAENLRQFWKGLTVAQKLSITALEVPSFTGVVFVVVALVTENNHADKMCSARSVPFGGIRLDQPPGRFSTCPVTRRDLPGINLCQPFTTRSRVFPETVRRLLAALHVERERLPGVSP
jgi:hypothetical protein